MTGPQAVALPSAERRAARRASLRPASLAVLILLIAQLGLGVGVNLYVTLPPAGQPGHSSWFGNGTLLATHSALGMILILGAVLFKSGRSWPGA